jgi:MFS family permease
MKLAYLLIVVFILSFTIPTASTAQSKILTVITTTQDTLRNCKIAGVDNDTVELILGDGFVRIPVDSIHALILLGGSRFWTGAGYGAAIGGLSGTIIGATQKIKPRRSYLFDYSGIEIVGGILIGAAAGFVIGGVIGAEFKKETRCDLSGLRPEDKVKMLKSLIED